MADLTSQTEGLEIGQAPERGESRSLQNDSPISSLPHEILAAVFFIGWQTQIPRDHSTKGPLPFEIVISHVSHHWRCVALGTPILWTNIIRFEFQEDINPISAYLCRSGLVAFDLTIAISQSSEESDAALVGFGDEEEHLEGPGQPTESTDLLFQLIEPHLERCKSLSIYLLQHKEGDIFLRRLSTVRASYLRSLKVSYFPVLGAGPSFETPLKIFQGGAPALNHLELNTMLFASCHPPTSNITSLSVGTHSTIYHWPPPGTHFVTALPSMHLLSKLEIAENAYEWPSHMPIKLSRLRQLIYTGYNGTSPFLLALDAPLLEDLSFIFPPSKIAFDAALVRHCPEKLPLVRTLCLTREEYPLSPMDARLISRTFPLITKLSYSPPQHRTLSAILSYSPSQPVTPTTALAEFFACLREVDPLHGAMWPHLTTLNISDSAGLETFPVEEIKATVIFRASAGYPEIGITRESI